MNLFRWFDCHYTNCQLEDLGAMVLFEHLLGTSLVCLMGCELVQLFGTLMLGSSLAFLTVPAFVRAVVHSCNGAVGHVVENSGCTDIRACCSWRRFIMRCCVTSWCLCNKSVANLFLKSFVMRFFNTKSFDQNNSLKRELEMCKGWRQRSERSIVSSSFKKSNLSSLVVLACAARNINLIYERDGSSSRKLFNAYQY